MGLFSSLTTEGLEKQKDSLGGYAAKESDVYTGTIKAFYAGKSANGAHSITLIVTGGDFGSTEYRETVYITNRKGENYYLTNDKKKSQLPGFIVINDICLATLEKPLSELEFEEKVMNIYNAELKKEVPTNVQMAVEILGQEISLGILKSTENQTEKDSQGNYVPKADGSTREVNNIDKVFNTPTRMTIDEATEAAKTGEINAQFMDKWIERNKNKTRDRTKKDGQGGRSTGGNGGNAGAPPQSGQANGGGAPRSSLFGAKK